MANNSSITTFASLSLCKKLINSIIGPNLSIDDELSLTQETELQALNKSNIYLTFGRQKTWNSYVSDEYTITSALAEVVQGNTVVILSANAKNEISVGDNLNFKNKGLPSVFVGTSNVLTISSDGKILELNSAPSATIANATIVRTNSEYSDINPPLSPNSVYYGSEIIWNNMIGGKLITGNDLCVVVKRYNWTSNTIYSKYDPNDATLFDKAFYVLTSQNSVYKCLDNANDSVSTIEPTYIPTNDWVSPVETSDGYIWKYMFTLSNNDILKFLTSTYMPVRYLTSFSNQPLDQWSVQTSAINGAIENVIVVNSGSGYIVPADGLLTVSILGGGGLGATAIVDSVDGGTISSISVVTPGAGYGSNVSRSFTSTNNSSIITHVGSAISNNYVNSSIVLATVPSNTYITTIDNASNPKKVYLSANATMSSTNTGIILGIPRVEISGGGGSNASAHVVVTSNSISSVVVDNVGQDYISPIIFNVIGDGQDAAFSIDTDHIGLNGEILGINVDNRGNNYSNVVINITGGNGSNALLKILPGPNGGHGSNPEKELGGKSVMFSIDLPGTNEFLQLSLNSDYRQIALLENPISSNTSEIMTESAFFQPETIVVSSGINDFEIGEIIYQGETLANATFSGIVQLFDTANNILYVTNTFYKDDIRELSSSTSIIGDTSGTHREFVSQIASPIEKYSGDILFIQNFEPIERAYNQSEAVRIVFNQ